MPSSMQADAETFQQNASRILPEVEALLYQGKKTDALSQQGNNAIQGTQVIDKNTYRLVVTGLVEKNLNMSYEELLKLPAYCGGGLYALRGRMGIRRQVDRI